MYRRLLEAWGHQGWWPGRTVFEVCVGAVLTQNTSWRNVEKALANLRATRRLTLDGVHTCPRQALAQAITPARYANVKARYLHAFCQHVQDHHTGKLRRMLSPARDTADLRRELLGITGIGPETADSILCYAGRREREVFVVDAYTRRIAHRLGLTAEDASYHDLQSFFTSRLLNGDGRADLDLADFHAQLVNLGKDHCRPNNPRCENCPLAKRCPTAA